MIIANHRSVTNCLNFTRVFITSGIMRANKYDKSAELYAPPVKEDTTFSWHVHFEFSGGVTLPVKKTIDSQYMTGDETKAVDEYYKEVDGKWGPMGFPSLRRR